MTGESTLRGEVCSQQYRWWAARGFVVDRGRGMRRGNQVDFQSEVVIHDLYVAYIEIEGQERKRTRHEQTSEATGVKHMESRARRVLRILIRNRDLHEAR
jgi:hypothetical protein